MNKVAVLEGLLFVVGDDGITLDKICDVLEINENEARNLLKELQNEYEKETRGIRISYLSNSFKLTTKKEHIDYYQKLIKDNSNSNDLSQAALETLAIIAYNEPITRVDIDNLRGISSAFMIKKLMAKDLVKVCGKSDLPGHPNLYKTTKDFLDYFGLASISDLPEINVNKNKNDEVVELYKSNYKEEN
ncbi:MAG: SMC-Scp complex subunit ScpB [bacterium]|nr:SMC-Scp complex subunit ScpB [bacterium]